MAMYVCIIHGCHRKQTFKKSSTERPLLPYEFPVFFYKFSPDRNVSPDATAELTPSVARCGCADTMCHNFSKTRARHLPDTALPMVKADGTEYARVTVNVTVNLFAAAAPESLRAMFPPRASVSERATRAVAAGPARCGGDRVAPSPPGGGQAAVSLPSCRSLERLAAGGDGDRLKATVDATF